MPETSVTERRQRGNPRGRQQLDRRDQALLAAKNADQVVNIDLAVETRHADEDGWIAAKVLQVDKYSVQVKIVDPHKPGSFLGNLWLSKAFIVSVEIEGE